ncbi:MAG: quinoprotein glucose dehydrogenase [Chitinophagales bacterium]|jgi:quinoprotein glucose dehydrogenase
MKTSTIRKYYLLLSAFIVVSCTQSPVVLNKSSESSTAGWPVYGATAGGTRFSQASQITPDNVAGLVEVWRHTTGDKTNAVGREGMPIKSQSSHVSTPILIDDRLYYCSPFNRVFALDAKTGKELWSFDPAVNYQESFFKSCRGVSSWQSGKTGFCEHRIFSGTLDGRLISLDADTGKKCPDFADNGEVDLSYGLSKFKPWEYGVTSPPAILNNLVITGSSVLDNQRADIPSGVVRAYDARSGKLVWTWNPVPKGAAGKNANGTYLNGTTNVWSIISVDAARNMIFVPTGNVSPDFYGGHRNGLDYYSSAVVALDGDTGEVIWHYQTVHHDIWDYDAPAQPTLIDLTVEGETIPAVIQVTKMGMTFALHRDTGKPIWPIEERSVPQTGAVEGEYLSPTQPFPSHIPYLVDTDITPADAWGLTLIDKYACKKKLALLNNQGLYTPPSLNGSLHFPSSGGGNNWGTPAIDPNSNIMVVYTVKLPGEIVLIPRQDCNNASEPQVGTPYCANRDFITSPIGLPCVAPPWGTLDAIDLAAGKILWRVPLGTTRDMAPFPFWWIEGLPGIAAPMITKGGLVFSGISNEHAFRAFDLKTGIELWKTRLPTAANALPMSYQLTADGRQYIVVAVGGHWSGGAPAGDYLIAYALPDSTIANERN